MNSGSKSEDEIFAFVRTTIHSVCALELLIFLRTQSQRSFSFDELVRALRSSEQAIGQALVQLTATGLVIGAPDSGYRYQQTSRQLDILCQQIEAEYIRRPMKIIEAVLEAPHEKLRIFSDAFRLSRKRE